MAGTTTTTNRNIAFGGHHGEKEGSEKERVGPEQQEDEVENQDRVWRWEGGRCSE